MYVSHQKMYLGIWKHFYIRNYAIIQKKVMK